MVDYHRQFDVFSISRNFLINLGFNREDISKLSDAEMQEIANILWQCNKDFVEGTKLVVSIYLTLWKEYKYDREWKKEE